MAGKIAKAIHQWQRGAFIFAFMALTIVCGYLLAGLPIAVAAEIFGWPDSVRDQCIIVFGALAAPFLFGSNAMAETLRDLIGLKRR
ncbi:hypothetical protein [Sphingobium phenoxybenzoativorans]|uniref:hypothetical protein n=1 Tax=Sphingobium phenoxybenzoativorans TaxID=1592790 RepID=UPI0008733562|nr:hypothetical protein [Sphingobium phenoxybenzoativorans]